MRIRFTVIALTTSTCLAVSAIWLAAPSVTAQGGSLTLATISSRADMVSGGDTLLEIRGAGTSMAGVRVTADGRDVTRAFGADATRGSLVGLVDGLKLGANTVEARADARTVRLTVTNFPDGGAGLLRTASRSV